jgi:hypothetical protein
MPQMKRLKELKLLVSNETLGGRYGEVGRLLKYNTTRHICPSINLISRSCHHFIYYVYVDQQTL